MNLIGDLHYTIKTGIVKGLFEKKNTLHFV